MASNTPFLTGYCANCMVYGWKQPEEPELITKCFGCGTIQYCGDECQDEHLIKVHQEHCEYLGGKKKSPVSVHTKASCSGCSNKVKAGKYKNPSYPCIHPRYTNTDVNLWSPHPFPLEGLPGDRQERIVILL
jgi:hypothetical protein